MLLVVLVTRTDPVQYEVPGAPMTIRSYKHNTALPNQLNSITAQSQLNQNAIEALNTSVNKFDIPAWHDP